MDTSVTTGLRRCLFAVGVVWEAVVAIGNTITITIAVTLIHDAIAVEITVRTILARLAPLMA